MLFSRRTICSSLLLAPMTNGASGFVKARERLAALPRIVTLDVTATAILTSMGIVPAGAAPAGQYRPGQSDTHLPPSVIDVGQPAEPNLEVLDSLRPDLIISSWPMALNAPIRSIAPILLTVVAGKGNDWFESVAAAVRQVGRRLDRENDAEQAIQATNVVLAATGAHLPPRSVYLVNLDHDGLNIRIYGRRSLMDSVMRRIGVRNAFSGEDNMWGWRTVSLDVLLAEPDASIAHLPQYWENAGLAKQRLTRSPLWRALPQVLAGRVFTLAPIDIYGGFASATRFAASMVEKFGQEGQR